MPYNFSPPAIDFSPLGRLGETYDRSRRAAVEQERDANRQKILGSLGQNADLAALGRQLLQAGDLEGGMSALRLAAANEGTPFQRARAAAEDARAAEADAYRRRQEEENTRRYEETKTRADRPEYVSQPAFDIYGNPAPPREGKKMPDGTVIWNDQSPPVVGPQSSLPAPESEITQAQLGVPKPGSTAERGYVIPGSLEGYPHGTTRMAGDPDAIGPGGVPVQATLPGPAVAGPVSTAPPGAVPLAPPAIAGRVAVAAPPAPAAIQRRARVDDPLEPETAPFVRVPPPNVNKQAWVTGETKRLAELAGGGDKAPTKEQADARAAAGKMEGAEKAFRPNEGETISVTERLKSAIAPGNSEHFITSTGYQKGVAAKKEWIAGLLRKESGAAVTPAEFEYYNDIYFPAVGQGGEVAAQKAQARERALLGVRAGMSAQQLVELNRTGGGVPEAPGQGTPPPPPPLPAIGETISVGDSIIRRVK